MSAENFHAALFTTRLMAAYHEAIRGPALKMDPIWDEELGKLVVEFVDAINESVEQIVRERLATQAEIAAEMAYMATPSSAAVAGSADELPPDPRDDAAQLRRTIAEGWARAQAAGNYGEEFHELARLVEAEVVAIGEPAP
jgi:hypothetical protein